MTNQVKASNRVAVQSNARIVFVILTALSTFIKNAVKKPVSCYSIAYQIYAYFLRMFQVGCWLSRASTLKNICFMDIVVFTSK